VRHKLARSDFPNTDFSFHASRADELVVGSKADSSYSSLVSVFNFPEQLAVIDSVSSDSAVSPSTDDNFVSEDCTVGVNVTSTFHLSGVGLSSASGDDRVIVGVPQPNWSIFTGSDKFVRDSGHEPGATNGLGVRFAKKHLSEISSSDTVDESLIGGSHQLSTIGRARESVHGAVVLGFHNGRCVFMVSVKEDHLAVTTTNADLLGRNSNDVSYSEGHQVDGKDKHFVLDLESN
jgi:hypothetical protein